MHSIGKEGEGKIIFAAAQDGSLGVSCSAPLPQVLLQLVRHWDQHRATAAPELLADTSRFDLLLYASIEDL